MGKYQKILAKDELSYDDLLTLNAAKKLKKIIGALVVVKHGSEMFIKPISQDTLEYARANAR